jgi:probable phosphoglycerate mutase
LPVRNGPELLLIRHGQSVANAAGIWQGRLDFPLSDEGREQARITGRALARKGLDAAYSSPLGRALETAEIIAREAGYGGTVTTLDGLLERGGGRLEGTTHEERARKDPGLVEKLSSLPEEERWELVGAETDEQVLSRFEDAVARILEEQRSGGRVLVVSHGGAMRAFLRDRFGHGVLPGRERAANASITRVSFNGSGDPRLLTLASTKHLSPGHETRPTSE